MNNSKRRKDTKQRRQERHKGNEGTKATKAQRQPEDRRGAGRGSEIFREKQEDFMSVFTRFYKDCKTLGDFLDEHFFGKFRAGIPGVTVKVSC